MHKYDKVAKEVEPKRQALRAAQEELDVLTREEFDAQARALGRAQQRVTELETLITDLESRLATLEQQQSQS